MKRLLVVAATLAAVFVPGVAANAAGNANVTIVQGLGPAPNPLDIYQDGALVAENLVYSTQAVISVPEGQHIYTACAHSGAATPTLPGAPAGPYTCPVSASFPNSGVPLSVVGGNSYTLVSDFAPSGQSAGRPSFNLFQDDLSCATDARMDLYSAAAAVDPPNNTTDFLYGTQVLASDVAPGGIARAHGTPQTATVTVRRHSDQGTVVSQANVTTSASTLTIKILVGNASQEVSYELLTRQVTLTACPTTTTSTSTTTTVLPVTVTPRFTG